MSQNEGNVGFMILASGVPIFECYVERLKEHLTFEMTLLSAMISALQSLSKEIAHQSFEQLDFGKIKLFVKPSEKSSSLVYVLLATQAVTKKIGSSIIDTLRRKFESEYWDLLSKDIIVRLDVPNPHDLEKYLVNFLEEYTAKIVKMMKKEQKIKNIRSDFF